MEGNSPLRFTCIICRKEELQEEGASLRCPGCGASWELKGGIADLGGDIPYYGDLPKERMKEVIEEAREKGWKKALFDNFYSTNWYLYVIAAYETRADWLYLLDLSKDDLVLDVGSGWGTEAIPLARNAGFVAALDGTFERLEFMMVRAGQEGSGNISGVRGSILDPPLIPGQFDLVVLNGVLEWIGTADETVNPLSLQKQALNNVHGLLKNGGRLYLGIENSHGFKYLLGEPDDHTGIRDITFQPRDRANRLMQALRGQDYRTYTHSYTGYKSMLEEAGFAELEFYYPMPDYKTFTFMSPLGNTAPYGYCLDKLDPDSSPGTLAQNIRNLERSALKDGTLKDHCSSYGIVARKV